VSVAIEVSSLKRSDKYCRHLARDEMHTITEDKWDQEVWGAARAEGTNNRDTANWNLTLYWGQGVILATWMITNDLLLTFITG